METTRPMTRSPVELARKAVEIAGRALPAYSSPFSRKDFTQPQLFAVMVLMTFLRTDPRGIVGILKDWSDVRGAIGLRKVPHYSTIYKAQQRLLKKVLAKGSSTRSSTTPGSAAWSGPKRRPASIPPASNAATARRITRTGRAKNPT
jgi:hypothetical protein